MWSLWNSRVCDVILKWCMCGISSKRWAGRLRPTKEEMWQYSKENKADDTKKNRSDPPTNEKPCTNFLGNHSAPICASVWLLLPFSKNYTSFLSPLLHPYLLRFLKVLSPLWSRTACLRTESKRSAFGPIHFLFLARTGTLFFPAQSSGDLKSCLHPHSLSQLLALKREGPRRGASTHGVCQFIENSETFRGKLEPNGEKCGRLGWSQATLSR